MIINVSKFIPGVCLCGIILGAYGYGRKTAFKDANDMVDVLSAFGNGIIDNFNEKNQDRKNKFFDYSKDRESE